LGDSPANLFQSLENAEGSQIPEALSSLNSQGFLKIKDPSISSLKMLKDCYLITVDSLSKPSSPRLMNWGMIVNGKCLTARISESHRIGKECSLSDILEESVDQKYFLSEKIQNRLIEQLKERESQQDAQETLEVQDNYTR